MKTVRFTSIVEACGKPESHLLLTSPDKDKGLQRALKEHKVMTVHQETVGSAADFGEVGLDAGPGRQFLIFPKSLKKYKGAKVVGIRYEMLGGEEKRKQHGKAKVSKPKKKPSKPAASPEPSKVVKFTQPPPSPAEDMEEEEIWQPDVRQAMQLLEEGKQIAAFNVLKRLLQKEENKRH